MVQDPYVPTSSGRDLYFYNSQTQSSSWYLSADTINKLIESTVSEKGEIKPERQSSERSVVSVETDRDTAADDATAEESVCMERWTVKLHPDSGQAYYVDALSDVSTWCNPFEVDQTNEIFEKITLEAEKKRTPVDETEKLAGFDDVPNRDVFFSDYVLSTKERLTQWIDRRGLQVSTDYAAMLNYPEYMDVKQPFSESSALQVVLRLPKGMSDDPSADTISSITMRQTLGDTVGKMMVGLFKKFQIRNGRALDENGMEGYIFKVVGYHEYLLHSDFPLGYYECAVNCARDKQKLDLLLVKLLPAELMDVGPIMSMSSSRYLEYDKATPRPDGDDWTVDEAQLLVQDSTSSGDYLTSNILKSSINWPLRVLIQGVSDCPHAIACDLLQVEVNLYFNDESLLSSPCMTRPVPFSSDPRFPQIWIDTKLEVAALPPTTRIAFTLVGSMRPVPGQPSPPRTVIAGVCITLIDYKRHLVTGERVLNMFPHQNLQIAMDPVKFKHEAMPEILNLSCGMPGGNGVCTAGALHVVFDSYSVPVIAEIKTLYEVIASQPKPITDYEQPSAADGKQLEVIGKKDTLYSLTHADKLLLWKYRHFCSRYPNFLPKFLRAVNWAVPAHVEEAYRCLVLWAEITPEMALGLLDICFCDPVVREYAIRVVDRLPDAQLQEFLLQLVQVLKYEAFHDSPLSRLLLRRALRSPLLIGHHLFWMLKSEMHCAGVLERFGTLLYLYILNCGPHETSLRKQAFVNDKIKVIADQIKTIPNKERRIEEAKKELEVLDGALPSQFCVCLTPRIECRGIKYKKCKVMDSKKLPLWIVFENADPYGKDFYTIFKSGDDLRQDQITLQLLRIMDSIWRGTDSSRSIPGITENSLDLKLKPYKCCSTGQDLGMIEVVIDSDTTANIMTGYGGKLTGAFSSTPIDLYLRENNQHGLYPCAVENFVRTCAGYCVATYVLGIGDRHAGNIMVSKSGHLFHIDFGHFLGNFKKKYGFNRERAPFVFTPEMAYVMRDTKIQGATYHDFERMCCEAYNMLRRRADLFINLFILMVPAAMPELLEKSDISYLREMLSLELTTEQANAKFIAEIKNSLNTVSRRIDNWFHTMKH
mmetsp:Transcript_2716/g.4078  ORF Transcript_2716/g.4078 Transcript_2716/m.4078 type:complete len:1101 (-) Transcript_2716:95-3397(-)|eukprot:CAMPEP_0185036784 /NCGR_PEP_ID=MMETSP1103-20130426/30247_1 /TAXON_ID=36769 /ORGANISM="Paraphysomonas bandaiensis, Strain Caron Lab Isolate" /LENGTH=1100 /DNA_ID=CAMNT_0027574461 /DNA_START=28 /DNA_END=3330 /DNA_ORIENTATION=-